MTVYADMVFLINFIMDSFILWIVSKIFLKNVHKKRQILWLAAGGMVMALLYCLTIFTAALRFMNTIAASILILSLGVAIALRPTCFKSFIKMLLTAYGVAFLAGGLGMTLFYLTDLPYAVYYLTNNPAATGGISWKIPAACIIASYLAIKLGLRAAERITLKRQVLYPVHIFIGDTDISFEALVDTGHSLREPITQAPVIVAEFEQVKPFLPDELKLLFFENQESNLSLFLTAHENNTPFYSRVRMIPFTSLGRANGLLIGFRPDRVAVSTAQKEMTREDVVIGIYNSRLSRDGRYHGLLSPELIAG